MEHRRIWRPVINSDPYGEHPSGSWLNRVHAFEAGKGAEARVVHFPKSCLHCEDAPCVTVCRQEHHISGKRMALCWCMKIGALDADYVHGHALMVQEKWIRLKA